MVSYICGAGGLRAANLVQRTLTEGSCIPVIGVVPSVVKVAVSAVQTVAGLAMGIIFTVIGQVFNNYDLERLGYCNFRHVKNGLRHLSFSVVNITTLGFAGFLMKRTDSAQRTQG